MQVGFVIDACGNSVLISKRFLIIRIITQILVAAFQRICLMC